MWSSASTNTFTTSFTTDTKNGLPSYSDVLASAPLLHETPSSIFGAATNLTFEYNSSGSDGYSFLIRDTFGCLQAKGEVKNLNITLQNVNGMEMLRITERIDENDASVHTFKISHKNRSIGTVTVAEQGSASTCLKIDPEIIVRSLKIGDFAIFRPNSMTSPLCNIQMPSSDIYKSEEFNGTIIFHPQTGINTEEQLLCTAAAIAFVILLYNTFAPKYYLDKVTTKQKAANDDNESNVIGYCLGMVLVIFIIGVLVMFHNYMEGQSCERRKAAGYSSYVNREC